MSKSRISARRDRAAAGLDAAGLVEEQDRAAGAGEIRRRGRARRAAADHDDIVVSAAATAHRVTSAR